MPGRFTVLLAALAFAASSSCANASPNTPDMVLGEPIPAPAAFTELCHSRPDYPFCNAPLASIRPSAASASGPPTGNLIAVDRSHANMAIHLLQRVNYQVNSRVRQVSDEAQYNQTDKWRPTGIAPGASGDCEDIAIEKRLQLLAAGYPPHRLSFGLVFSMAAGLHVVLVANTDGNNYVLDSRNPRVMAWHDTPYSWIGMQTGWNPLEWRRLVRPLPGAPIAGAGDSAFGPRAASPDGPVMAEMIHSAGAPPLPKSELRGKT